MEVKPIKSEGDYAHALARVEALWDSPDGTAQADELETLVAVIEAYEQEHYSDHLLTRSEAE